MDARGGVIIQPPAPDTARCVACGGEITLTEEMAQQLRSVPGATVRHETCPEVAAQAAREIHEYTITTTIERRDSIPTQDPADAAEAVFTDTVLMRMAHTEAAATLAEAWDALCYGIVAKYNEASMHASLADAEDTAATHPEEAP